MASASEELQKLVVDTLKADPAVSAIVGDRVYDNAPKDAQFPYISLGPSDFYEDDSDCITGTVETIQIDVWHRDQNRKRLCKATVRAIYDVLHKADLMLPDPHALSQIIVGLTRVMNDPDGVSVHGVVGVEATLESA